MPWLMKKWLAFSLMALWACQQTASAQQPYALVVHGGAGADPAQMEPEEIEGVKARISEVLTRGLEELKGGKSALRVVEQAVRALEDDPWFNAGRGAALNSDGEAELDAAIMDGSNLHCGGVADVRRVKNPITLARWVMEKTPHVLLVGLGADRFGEESGLEIVNPEYFITERARRALRKKQGTVGCVALDRQGHLAAATSTGGLTNKRPGRVGDSPIIGAGTFADDRSCAVSGTGVGEEFIRHQVAGQISQRIRLTGVTLPESVRQTFADGLPDDVGGVIAVNRKGEWVMHFNTAGMSRGVATSKGEFKVAIGKEGTE
ncbi:MAG: isoaspartyl peptidase/L-asparaginase [Candidatus Eremiobacteraeota bacterium]|nr:isoaspartyl peptidase/L-asparaginase [Candidatus Eremiobacteraeota bacterium]